MCIREFYDRKQPSAFTTVHLTAASLGAYAPQPPAVPGADPQEAEEGSPNAARPPARGATHADGRVDAGRGQPVDLAVGSALEVQAVHGLLVMPGYFTRDHLHGSLKGTQRGAAPLTSPHLTAQPPPTAANGRRAPPAPTRGAARPGPAPAREHVSRSRSPRPYRACAAAPQRPGCA